MPSPLLCPRCQTTLVMTDNHGVVSLHCPKCKQGRTPSSVSKKIPDVVFEAELAEDLPMAELVEESNPKEVVTDVAEDIPRAEMVDQDDLWVGVPELNDDLPMAKMADDNHPRKDTRPWQFLETSEVVEPQQNYLPSLKRSVAENVGLWFVKHLIKKLAVLLLIAPIAGVCLILTQAMEGLPYLGANQEPQVISCSDLISNGVGDNPYVVLTDFRMDASHLWMKHSFLDESIWEEIWVPLVPSLPGQIHSPIRVILNSKQVKTWEDLKKLNNSGRIKGLLLHGATGKLPGGWRNQLEKENIRDDFRQSWLLQLDEKPPSPWTTFGNIGLGVLLILGGSLVWVLIWWYQKSWANEESKILRKITKLLD